VVIFNRTAKRRRLRFQDRLFWGALARFWQDWRSALLIVQPKTVINKRASTLLLQIPTQICEKESASGAMKWSNKTYEHPAHLLKVVELT